MKVEGYDNASCAACRTQGFNWLKQSDLDGRIRCLYTKSLPPSVVTIWPVANLSFIK